MPVYGFRSKPTALRAEKFFRNNRNSTTENEINNWPLPARVRVVELTEDIDGAGDPEESGAYEKTDADIVRTSVDPPERLETNGGFITQIEAAPLESTNLPEDARVLALTDTFNQTFLMTLNPSEVFGTIDAAWTNTDMESAVSITLDDGFTVHGESTLEAYPSPTLPESLDADTPVTCRFIKSKGAWFFFRPDGAGLCHTTVTCSGDALYGFGTHSDGKQIWSTQLAASVTSADVGSLNITAVSATKQAVGSDDNTPWIEFPTTMRDGSGNIDTTVKYVKGNFYWTTGNVIYNKEDFRSGYVKNGQVYRDTLFTFNSQPLYKYSNLYLYNDGYGKWMCGTLGIIHSDNDPGANTITGLGFTEYSKPYWSCSTQYGVYQPQNGASGTKQFGLPQWNSARGTVPAGDNTTAPAQMPTFTRSIKQDANNHWIYRGKMELTITGTTKKFTYNNIKYDSNGHVWILGNINDKKSGWYECSSEPSTGTATTCVFHVLSKSNKSERITNLLLNRSTGFNLSQINTVTEGSVTIYFIRDTNVARWVANNTTLNTNITFNFSKPEGSTEPTQSNLSFSMKTYIDNDLVIPDSVFPTGWTGTKSISLWTDSSSNEYVLIGSKTDEKGCWSLKVSDYTNTLAMTHGAVPRANITLTFNQYVALNTDKEQIWLISPEILT